MEEATAVEMEKKPPLSTKQGMGRRRWNRYKNDKHLDPPNNNIDPTDFMTLQVESHSKVYTEFFKEENKHLRELYLECQDEPTLKVMNHPLRRSVEETMFLQIQPTLRMRVLHAFPNLSMFIHSVEQLLLYFGKWNEAPGFLEILKPLRLVLNDLPTTCENGLILNCQDIPSLRKIIHGVCQFYGFKSETNSTGTRMKIEKSTNMIIQDISLCDYIYTNRLSKKNQIRCVPWRDVYSCSSSEGAESDDYQVIYAEEC